MNREQAKKLADSALQQLTEALAAGRSQALTEYLQAMGRFHHYSFGNVMLIARQRPSATYVAGFTTWKKLGRHVRKGERGIVILAPLITRKQADECRTEAPRQQGEGERILRGFKAAHVFDIAQTDGEELPQITRVTGNPGHQVDRLRDFIRHQGIQIEYQILANGIQGLSTGGAITVRPDLQPAEEFSVLVHEVAHELLHRGDRRSETTRLVRETEAEAVSFVVCQAIGLQTGTHSSDYIQLYRGDTATLADSLEYIQKTAARIIQALQVGS